MSDADLIQVIRTVALPLIFVLVAAIAIRQLDRVYRHWRYGDGSPEILKRDVLFFLGLAMLFIVPALAGTFGIILALNPLWVLFSTTVAIAILAIFAFYEYVLIGRQK